MQAHLDYFLFFVLGSMVGSFLNVIILRWPRGESFMAPRSQCPHCKTGIPFYLNVPILAWLFLKGKTRCCKKPISPFYLFFRAFNRGFCFY